jgi:hypothetical protein
MLQQVTYRSASLVTVDVIRTASATIHLAIFFITRHLQIT